MSKLSKRHFWEWFKQNKKEYSGLSKKTDKEKTYWLNEMNAHLRAYFKFFEFSIMWEDETPVLIITVKGKAQHFKKVEAFVAKAPEIPGWKIIALEYPLAIDFFLEKEIEDSGVHPVELSFSFPGDDPESGSITVYHPLITEKNKRAFWNLAHAAIYNLLGERSFGLDIYEIEVSNLSIAVDEVLRSLEELPSCLGMGKSSMIVDDEGKLMDLY
jgi:hypothetical protein